MIDLAPQHLSWVKEILQQQVPDCEVWVFGSRVNGKARQFSDLDLLLQGSVKLNWRVIERLKDAFSASDLPMIVDVVDAYTVSAEMLETMTKERI